MAFYAAKSYCLPQKKQVLQKKQRDNIQNIAEKLTKTPSIVIIIARRKAIVCRKNHLKGATMQSNVTTDIFETAGSGASAEEILTVSHLYKRFKLSRKQKQIAKKQEDYIIAVNDLSFSAYRGEIFGLLGPNGAGKTTTLRMLSTLIRPDSGDIVIDNSNVLTQSEAVRSKIGFLTSDLKLEEFFTPNYLFDFFADLRGVDRQTRDERKKQLFSLFGIEKFAEVKVGNLSTGMKQKASLVISLVHDPEFIIFDEPTNGLDVLTAKVVTDFLLHLRDTGHTIIVSTHIFSLVDKICDRVGIILDGHMVTCGEKSRICGGKNMEDAFFDIYYNYTGGEQQ